MVWRPAGPASTLRLFVEAPEAPGADWRAILRSSRIEAAELGDPDGAPLVRPHPGADARRGRER